MKNLKILFLPASYFPNVSGVPVVVKYLAEGLFAKGHIVSIATCCFQNEPIRDNINGIDVYRFNIWKDWKHSYKGDLREYVDFVINFDADVVVLECSQCITTDTILPYLNKLRSKIIFHSHGFSGLELSGPFALHDSFYHTIGHTYTWLTSQFYFKYWFKKYAKFFNSSLVLSELDSGKPFLDNLLGSKNYILGNATDDMFFKDYSKCCNPLENYIELKSSKYCFSCANYIVVKNQKRMLREFYKTKDKDCALICIGGRDTPYYYECLSLKEKLDKQYGYREVHLLYNVERRYIPIIVSKASLYITSSNFEEFSISIIEAMSQGIPFVSTNVGNASILPGGITVENPLKIHTAIDYLLSSPEKYAIYSKRGYKYSHDNCRIDVVVDRLEKIIKTTIES